MVPGFLISVNFDRPVHCFELSDNQLTVEMEKIFPSCIIIINFFSEKFKKPGIKFANAISHRVAKA